MASVSRRDLEDALVILLSAIRSAEGEQGCLHNALSAHVAVQHQNAIDNIGSALIEEGIDRVVDLLGSDVVDILESKE